MPLNSPLHIKFRYTPTVWLFLNKERIYFSIFVFSIYFSSIYHIGKIEQGTEHGQNFQEIFLNYL